jgi:hypothetical protein
MHNYKLIVHSWFIYINLFLRPKTLLMIRTLNGVSLGIQAHIDSHIALAFLPKMAMFEILTLHKI